jgi:Protein of unknown function (DUF2569)
MSVNSQEIQATRSDPMVIPAVTGWLLVLCILLTLVYPATSLYAIFWKAVPKLVDAHSHTRILLLGVYSALFFAVAIFSFWAGVKLWLVKPDAVRFARRYLLTYLIANIAYFVFWTLVVRPTQMLGFAEMGWYHVVGPIVSTALWYFYLEHSKRARNTYRHG